MNSDMQKSEQYVTFTVETYNLVKELIQAANLEAGDLLVIGCSTSEVTGNKIGTASKPETARELWQGILKAAEESNIYVAAQCCEHLNRALIVEKELAKSRGYEMVNVVPQPKAGGSLATMAYEYMNDPVAVEHIKAEAGIDIGDTLIGMHLKDVAVPVRLSTDKLGDAHVVCAKTRLKYIGGERAKYSL